MKIKYLFSVYLFFIILVISYNSGYGQINKPKPILDIHAADNFAEISSATISNNGNYIFYTAYQNANSSSGDVILKSTIGNFQKEFPKLEQVRFSPGSNFLLGKQDNNLIIFNLKSHNTTTLLNVSNYESFINRKVEYLAAQYSNSKDKFSLSRLDGKSLFETDHISSFKISAGGNFCLTTGTDGDVVIIDIKTLTKTKFHRDFSASNFTFSDDENQLIFTTGSDDDIKIWHFKNGDQKSTFLTDNSSKNITKELEIKVGSNWGFSKNGKLFFLNLDNIESKTIDTSLVSIWNYQDQYLNSHISTSWGKSEAGFDKHHLAVLDIENSEIKQLLFDKEKVVDFKHETDSLLIGESYYGRSEDVDFLPSAKHKYFICNTKTGIKKQFKEVHHPIEEVSISPTGNFIIYYNSDSLNYFLYRMIDGIEINLTSLSKANFGRISLTNSTPYNDVPPGIVAWGENDEYLLIGGDYDVWKFSLRKEIPPVNITSEIRGDQKIVFYLGYGDRGKTLVKNKKVILSGFNVVTKDFGFFEIDPSLKENAKLLSMQPIYSGDLLSIYAQANIIKANDADKFVIRYSKKGDYPNNYFTADFKTFKPLSNLEPQSQYNWLKAELHDYFDEDGNLLQGILFKPEDFDSTKIYPVIFNFYTLESNLLNNFVSPALSGTDISIPHMVSDGYLVFQPDIFIYDGQPGKSALRSVLASVKYLTQKRFVNPKKLAISAHSFGGYEAGYIVTHTDLFTAAIVAAGVTNLTSIYNSIWGENGVSDQSYVKTGPYRMVKDLSDAPDLYLENSSIVFSKNMNTPLLMMHNINDGMVPFDQGRSFFIQLRSLQKKVWLLSYKGETHTIRGDAQKIDYFNKINGFLGYYLKDQPKPIWLDQYIGNPDNAKQN
jgi:dipeptidyl aminopeptidase/acylaminoacyl peptidase